jgi:hypothetical protein
LTQSLELCLDKKYISKHIILEKVWYSYKYENSKARSMRIFFFQLLGIAVIMMMTIVRMQMTTQYGQTPLSLR